MGATTLMEVKDNLGPSTRIGYPDRLPPGYEKEQEYLKSIIRSVVCGNSEGEKRSSSVIVFGPPESGKTSFVESTLAQLKKEKSFSKQRKVVRLDGLICTNFKSAIDEICWQLNITDTTNVNNNDDVEDNIVDPVVAGHTFDDRLEQTLQLLKSNLANYNRSVIFILESLELFAEHPNQSLLYNLFDLAANNSSVPVCIIGITCRVDVLDIFEKRVKSRFSHRKINLVGGFKDFENYKIWAFQLLSHWTDLVWNESIRKLYASNEISRILRYIHDTNKSAGKLILYLYTVTLTAESEFLTESDFKKVFDQMFKTSSKVQMALDLSTSELLVLISIYKQIQNNTQQAWQPQILFKTVDRVALSFSMKKEDFMQAVRKIHSLDLITEATSSQRGKNRNLSMDTYFKSELTFHEYKEIWSKCSHLPSNFQELL